MAAAAAGTDGAEGTLKAGEVGSRRHHHRLQRLAQRVGLFDHRREGGPDLGQGPGLAGERRVVVAGPWRPHRAHVHAGESEQAVGDPGRLGRVVGNLALRDRCELAHVEAVELHIGLARLDRARVVLLSARHARPGEYGQRHRQRRHARYPCASLHRLPPLPVHCGPKCLLECYPSPPPAAIANCRVATGNCPEQAIHPGGMTL